MLGITVICVGRLKDRFYDDASQEYIKRLKAYCSFDVAEIAAAVLPEEPNAAQINAALEKEADAIIKKIPKGAAVFSLCIEGKMLSSEKLSKLIERQAVSGVSKIVFIIGGSFGLSDRVKALSAGRISMSEMTFPHRLARIMLFEQLYRAFTITAGTPYHK